MDKGNRTFAESCLISTTIRPQNAMGMMKRLLITFLLASSFSFVNGLVFAATLDIVVLADGAVNVAVVEGTANVLDCERRRARVDAGQSGTVWAEGASCSETEVGSRPQVFAAEAEERDEILIVALPPEEEGPPPATPDDLGPIEENQNQVGQTSPTSLD